ncbi:MAG: SPOR domain-containing protein [Xanthomonadales bacterium]|nr:SPOR domain-containing protein [Xanthomonadales bacterium]
MDKVLKQRLVGASILIALAVIFLPMLFDSGEDDAVDQRELSLDMPERESGDRRVRRLALDPDQARRPPGETRAEPSEDESSESRRSGAGAPAEPEPRRQQELAPVEAEPGTASQPEATYEAEPENAQGAGLDEDGSEAEAASEPEDEPEPEASPEAAEPGPDAPDSSADGRWLVQVAVFSSRETAESIRQRLVDLGHRTSMDVLVRDQAELFRLRTGPYEAEADAKQARGQIAATVAGVDPVVRENPDDAGGQARQGLSVQVGSFASRNNAERLSGQLRGAGYDAFMHEEESGGRTIWRVRVGAYDERDDAERLLEELNEEQGLKGIVVSHP